jgi:MFS family permease
MSVPYRWVIVAAGGLMGCVAIGSMFSLPVFLSPIAQATGWSRTGLSTAMTINFLALAVTGFGWGILVDRFGPRLVVLSGGVLLGLGIALASRSQSLLEFQLVYGLLVGAGAGAIFAPLMATVTGWFDTQRSLAVSLVSAGMGVAPMTVAPLAARLVSIYDWRTSQLLIAILAWAVLLPAALRPTEQPAARLVGVLLLWNTRPGIQSR